MTPNSAVKFTEGCEKNMNFLLIQKSQKVWKKIKMDQAHLRTVNKLLTSGIWMLQFYKKQSPLINNFALQQYWYTIRPIEYAMICKVYYCMKREIRQYFPRWVSSKRVVMIAQNGCSHWNILNSRTFFISFLPHLHLISIF